MAVLGLGLLFHVLLGFRCLAFQRLGELPVVPGGKFNRPARVGAVVMAVRVLLAAVLLLLIKNCVLELVAVLPPLAGAGAARVLPLPDRT